MLSLTDRPREAWTEQEKAAIREEIFNDPTKTGLYRVDGSLRPPAELALALTRRWMIPNPEPAPQIPRPLDVMEILACVPVAELGAISDIRLAAGLVDDVRQSIRDQDRAAASNWAALFLRQRWITGDTHAAITAKLAETIPDPAHPAEIPGPTRLESLLGRPAGITAGEVAVILN